MLKLILDKRQQSFQYGNYRKLSHKIAEGFSSVMSHVFNGKLLSADRYTPTMVVMFTVCVFGIALQDLYCRFLITAMNSFE